MICPLWKQLMKNGMTEDHVSLYTKLLKKGK